MTLRVKDRLWKSGRYGNQEEIYKLWTLYRSLCETWTKRIKKLKEKILCGNEVGDLHVETVQKIFKVTQTQLE